MKIRVAQLWLKEVFIDLEAGEGIVLEYLMGNKSSCQKSACMHFS